MMLNGRLTQQQVRDLLRDIKERCDLASKDITPSLNAEVNDTLLKTHIQRIDMLLDQLRG